jgi:hypothetical protein
LGVTLQRGLGKKGDKDVIYVDAEGNVLKGKAKEKGKEEPKVDFTKTHPLLKRRKEEKTKDFFDVGREKR